jgi:hypothetical protein
METDGIDGSPGIWNWPLQRGHCISWPAQSSGTVNIFWQIGQRRFIADSVGKKEQGRNAHSCKK